MQVAEAGGALALMGEARLQDERHAEVASRDSSLLLPLLLLLLLPLLLLLLPLLLLPPCCFFVPAAHPLASMPSGRAAVCPRAAPHAQGGARLPLAWRVARRAR